MKIELDRLQELGGRFSHIYQPQELSLDDEDAALAEPADVRGSIKRSGEAVDLRGELRATIEVSCGRCLKPVRIPVNADFEERLIPAVSWSGEPQHELTEDDLNLSVFDGEAIDLDELVREEILLAVPGHVLCREDCQGLCPGCGIDRNLGTCQCETKEIDSRWEELKDFRL
jgi:uncharacterized protein